MGVSGRTPRTRLTGIGNGEAADAVIPSGACAKRRRRRGIAIALVEGSAVAQSVISRRFLVAVVSRQMAVASHMAVRTAAPNWAPYLIYCVRRPTAGS